MSKNPIGKLECFVQCEEGAMMVPLTPEDYPRARLTQDGTQKWYKCEACGLVFGYDKIRKVKLLAPETYDALKEKGIIKDYLEI